MSKLQSLLKTKATRLRPLRCLQVSSIFWRSTRFGLRSATYTFDFVCAHTLIDKKYKVYRLLFTNLLFFHNVWRCWPPSLLFHLLSTSFSGSWSFVFKNCNRSRILFFSAIITFVLSNVMSLPSKFLKRSPHLHFLITKLW